MTKFCVVRPNLGAYDTIRTASIWVVQHKLGRTTQILDSKKHFLLYRVNTPLPSTPYNFHFFNVKSHRVPR
jgi:hypothetical protein